MQFVESMTLKFSLLAYIINYRIWMPKVPENQKQR